MFEKESTRNKFITQTKVILQSPQLQRPTLPSQNLQIPNTKRVNHPTYVERKHIVPSLSHRSKVKPRPEVNAIEVDEKDE